MFAALATLAAAAASYFLGNGGGGGLIPKDINVTVDIWDRNKYLFVLLFLLVAALIISRL